MRSVKNFRLSLHRLGARFCRRSDKAAGNQEVGLLEIPIEVQGKAPRVLLVSASPWKDNSGRTVEVNGLFCIAQDFTEHKAMERARETFLASFSHEIRTPLNGVLGMLQVLCEFDLPSQALTYLRQACTSGNLLLNLINDILDLSKIDAGQLEIGEQMFNVGNTVKRRRRHRQTTGNQEGFITYPPHGFRRAKARRWRRHATAADHS